MAKHITIDSEACLGCGTCMALCPQTFTLSDDGKAVVANSSGVGDEDVQSAVDACPMSAIKVDEDVV